MRLTKLEKEMLAAAAEFVLAGEWPWEGDPERGNTRAQMALQRGADKLQGVYERPKEGVKP